jgi:dCMP deaminase
MDVAKRFAELSSAVRLQVGAIIVKEDRIVSIGYNGMPSGWSNICEDTNEDGGLKTKPEVIHAEANAIAKLAKSTESGKDATMFLTHAPCIDCAKQIFTAGIKTVYYEKDYRSSDGLKFLTECGVMIFKTSEPSDGSERG